MLGASMAVIRGLCTAEVGQGLSHRLYLIDHRSRPTMHITEPALQLGFMRTAFLNALIISYSIPPARRLIKEKQTFWLWRHFSCLLWVLYGVGEGKFFGFPPLLTTRKTQREGGNDTNFHHKTPNLLEKGGTAVAHHPSAPKAGRPRAGKRGSDSYLPWTVFLRGILPIFVVLGMTYQIRVIDLKVTIGKEEIGIEVLIGIF